MEKTISKKDYKPYLYIGIFLAAFAIMYAVNFILPIKKTIFIPFNNLTGRASVWCEFLICTFASYYIMKLRSFKLSDLADSVAWGIISFAAGWNGYVTAITTALSYYCACQIFRKYGQENKYFSISMKVVLKSLLFGILLAIPFAVVNNTVMSFMSGSGFNFKGFNLAGVFSTIFRALAPAISEEIEFRFFLLAFVTEVFKGSIPKNKITTFLAYFLCIVPHSLIHLPSVFVSSPVVIGLFILVFTSLIFGLPMTWLVKNKNLQTSIAFHWLIDFVRFTF